MKENIQHSSLKDFLIHKKTAEFYCITPLLLWDITQPFHTNISQKPIIPIFKSQEIQIHYIWTKTNKGYTFFL